MRSCYRVAALACFLVGARAEDLMPGRDFRDWTRAPIPDSATLAKETQWHVDTAARTLVCDGDKGHEWLRYDRLLGDFDLHVEWRFTPVSAPDAKYNSGVFVRTAANSSQWVQAQVGAPGSGGYFFWVAQDENGQPKRGSLKDQMPVASPVKPPGEWNSYDISARGPVLVLKVNGVESSRMEHAPLARGYVGLEAEGYRIEFRNLRVEEVK